MSGVSVISKRHAVANNKHVNDHDPSKPSNYLWYIDANNLYGKIIHLLTIIFTLFLHYVFFSAPNNVYIYYIF